MRCHLPRTVAAMKGRPSAPIFSNRAWFPGASRRPWCRTRTTHASGDRLAYQRGPQSRIPGRRRSRESGRSRDLGRQHDDPRTMLDAEQRLPARNLRRQGIRPHPVKPDEDDHPNPQFGHRSLADQRLPRPGRRAREKRSAECKNHNRSPDACAMPWISSRQPPHSCRARAASTREAWFTPDRYATTSSPCHRRYDVLDV